MAKRNQKIIFLLSLLVLLSSCIQIESTYKRENIEESVKKICKEEYSLEVDVQEVKDTIWIYAPLESLTTEEGSLDEEANEKIGNIVLSLQRVLLSIDKPPNFYVFVSSDIKKVGADLILIGFVPDIVKFQLRFISRDEFFQRRFLKFIINPLALGDSEGKHLKRFDIDLVYFMGLLIEQKIINTFARGDWASFFEVKVFRTSFDDTSKDFNIKIDIEGTTEPVAGLPDPFEETLKACSFYIHKIYNFTDFNYIKIEDLSSGKIQTLSRRALEEIETD
ncbi:MAG: hypothetical protein JW734_07465 [Candidatus Omnitrophica bacterium]|nr:hypothetical protein [Candidatus Omnitrophota bacterium]